MSQPPILRCGDWADLLGLLALHDEWRSLAQVPAALASAVLAAPAAVARSIALRAPALAARPELSILIVGAERADAPDRGRWYQAIPFLLGAECKVSVTLGGSSLDTEFSSAAAGYAPGTPATCMQRGLAECLNANAGCGFDIAVVFQPGFQKYRDWLDQRGFARLLAAGTLVFGSSYAPDEFQMERWVLESYGYRVAAGALQNPFYLELGDAQSSIRWGGVLWQIVGAPAQGAGINHEKLAALDTLNRMVMHSMNVVGAPSPPPGATVVLSACAGQSMQVIHLFDQRFVDPEDSKLLQLTADGQLESIGRLPALDLNQYPGGGDELERAIWAAGIKARCLLDTYPAGEVAGAAVAEEMFRAMQTRVAGLFR